MGMTLYIGIVTTADVYRNLNYQYKIRHNQENVLCITETHKLMS